MIEIPSLQINDCGLADYPMGGSLGPRTLPDYEILWIERGLATWDIEGGETWECGPGSVLVCPPGMVDTWHWHRDQATRHGYLHFEFSDRAQLDLPLRRDVAGDDVVRPLLRHAVWLAGQGDAQSDALAAEALQQALKWFLIAPDTPGGMRKRGDIHPVLRRALRALHEHWGNGNKVPPPIAAWATKAGVSRGHLSRVCRQELDVSPQELLRYIRLDHGLLWLSRTNLKIAEISEMCGFKSQFHFSRCFKDTYGDSPREVRKQLLAGGDKPHHKILGLRRLMKTRFTGSLTQIIA